MSMLLYMHANVFLLCCNHVSTLQRTHLLRYCSLILGLFRRFFRRCASILAQCYEGVGGRREEEKPPQVKTRGD